MPRLFRDIVKSNIFKNGILRNIFIVSIILVAALPLYNFLVIYPSFSQFLTEGTKDAAERVARHFVSMFVSEKAGLSKDSIKFDESNDIEALKSDFKLTKFKVFSNSGKILFSSEPEEIGNLNNHRYFHEILANGNVIAKNVQKETESLEGQLMPADVVETYVPLMQGDQFLGAMEIYYDITARKQQLDRLMARSSVLVFAIALGLLISIMVMLFVENKTISKRIQAEKERERLLAELQDAVAKIKTLSGLLPICSNCKKIRDDKGYWMHIESYIRDRSEAKFSHSICPECAKILYPDFFEE